MVGVRRIGGLEDHQFAGLGPQRHHRIGVFVVAGPLAAPEIRTRRRCRQKYQAAGFVEFFDRLSKEERRQVWGFTLPLVRDRNGEPAVTKAPDAFGRYLGWGFTGVVALQALLNVSVTVALLPTKGIPLPFMSYGGSSLVVTLCACGVLLNVSQHGS